MTTRPNQTPAGKKPVPAGSATGDPAAPALPASYIPQLEDTDVHKAARGDAAASAQPEASPPRAPEPRAPDGDGRMTLTRAALAGALAGAIGALAMALTSKAEAKVLLPEGAEHELPTTKLVETVAQERGAELSDAQAGAAGLGVSVGLGALSGALFGVVQSRLHPPELLHGLALSGLSYAATMPAKGLFPRLGVVPPPRLQSIEQAAVPVGAHLAFGLTTAAAYTALAGKE